MTIPKIMLCKASEKDCAEIHKMQIIAFKPLLNKYQDFETNPGAETLERIRQRFDYSQINHYFIRMKSSNIGYIRINQLNKKTCRLSQVFILPEFQEKGYAQQAILLAEKLYPSVEKWELDTIKQEQKLCHLYEKMGYVHTEEEKHIKTGMDLIFYAKSRLH